MQAMYYLEKSNKMQSHLLAVEKRILRKSDQISRLMTPTSALRAYTSLQKEVQSDMLASNEHDV